MRVRSLFGSPALLATLFAALFASRRARAQAPVTLVAVGDVALAWRVDAAIRLQQYDPFRETRAALTGADLAFANVECVMTDAPAPAWTVASRQPIIRASPSSARTLSAAGIDVVSVANNHAFDYAARGALDTQRALREAGVAPVGVGANREEAFEPWIREVRGVRVGVLAFAENVNHSPGRGARIATLGARAIEAVRALDARVDAVIVSVHWGREFVDAPTPAQVAFAHRLVDEGADAIIGHHPHVLQSVEVYRGRPIFYSLGNFVFGHQPSPRDLSAIAELSLQAGAQPVVRAALRPVRLMGRLGTPTLVHERAASPVIERLRSTSARFRTTWSERDGALELSTLSASRARATPAESLGESGSARGGAR